jgi:hypothetical protein
LHGPHCGSLSYHVGSLAALLGRDDLARASLLRAIAVDDEVGARPAAARARVALAHLLIRVEDARGAGDLCASVLAEARDLGLAKIESDALRLLARHEPSAMRRQPLRGSGLTSRDRRTRTARSTLAYGRALLTSRGRTALGRLVGDTTDEDLQRRFGAPWAQRALFESMTRGFQPSMAFGFEGDITFELLNEIGIESQPRASWWTISIVGQKATARRGAADAPAATVRVGVPNLIRLMTGTRNSVSAVEEAALDMDGDVLVISRLSEMFGGVMPLPTAT